MYRKSGEFELFITFSNFGDYFPKKFIEFATENNNNNNNNNLKLLNLGTWKKKRGGEKKGRKLKD